MASAATQVRPPTGSAPVSGFAFTKLVVADLARLERFYCDALGMQVRARLDIAEKGWDLEELILVVGRSQTLLNLIHYRDRPAPAPGEVVVGLSVDDLDATIAAAVAGGGSVAVEPVEIPEHKLRLAYVADPEGHLLELLQSL